MQINKFFKKLAVLMIISFILAMTAPATAFQPAADEGTLTIMASDDEEPQIGEEENASEEDQILSDEAEGEPDLENMSDEELKLYFESLEKDEK